MTSGVDLREIARGYVRRMIQSVPGLKALLVDEDTAGIVGVVEPQSRLLQHSVYLIELIGRDDGSVSATSGLGGGAHTAARSGAFDVMHAVVFVRPTAENILALRKELQAPPAPRFGSYTVFVSSVLRRTAIEELAEADVHSQLVQGVHEYFLDFVALAPHLFTFNVSPLLDVQALRTTQLNPYFERTFEGLVALLLAVKRRPLVRFQRSSSLCRNLAERLCVRMDQERQLFNASESDPSGRYNHNPPILLLVDRFEDPVTPLLNQWTYEAMVNERLGLTNNRVTLKGTKAGAGSEEVVLDADADPFYRSSRYSDFGELGVALKGYVDSFAEQTKTQGMVQSIDDMLRFVDNYPEFRKSSQNVTKHVALTGELSRLVDRDLLLEVSQLEQDMACREAEAEHRKQTVTLVGNPKVTQHDALRLVLLYALRYEGIEDKSGLRAMRDRLLQKGASSHELHLISVVLKYAGAARRSGDVFSNKTFYARAKNTVRRGIGGIDNVYTQHEPMLAGTLDLLLRGRLPLREFPLMGAADMDAVENVIPEQSVVFIAGGATYEESRCVAAINGKDAGVPASRLQEGTSTASAAAAIRMNGGNVLLGGSCMLTSSSFLNEASQTAAWMQ